MRAIQLLLMLLAVTIIGCSDDDGLSPDPGEQTAGQIRFEIGFAGQDGPQLRASTGSDFKSKFVIGDEVGIFAVKSGEPLAASSNTIHNMKVTYNGTNWIGAYWPNDENKNENLDFYAYYPYDAVMTDPTAYTFSIQVDQSGDTSGKLNYDLSDLLTAKAINQSKGSAVSLQFSHALSLVQIELESGNAVGANLYDLETVYLRAIGTTSSFDLATSTVIADTGETVTDIQMIKVDGLTNTYRALIPAQSISSGTVLFVISRGGSLAYTTSAVATLTQAKVSKYKITLQAPTLESTHTYAVGDPYPYLGLAEGIVCEISNGGMNGKIVSLDENSVARWDDSFYNTNARDNNNGRVNMNAVSNYINNNSKDWTNFPHFKWVHEKNGGGSTNYYTNSNAKGVWYLPSIDELQGLYCVFNGKAAETWYWQGSANPNEKYPTFKNEDTTSARNEFNQKLASYGGTALSLNWHWSSTEVLGTSGASYANDMNFSDGESYGSAKHHTNNARAMMAF